MPHCIFIFISPLFTDDFFPLPYLTMCCSFRGTIILTTAHCYLCLMMLGNIINVFLNGFSCLQSLATWENENKIYCKQTLIEGDGPKTYWTRELANDELILVRTLNCTLLTGLFVTM